MGMIESAIHEGEHLSVVTLERVNPRRNAYQYYVLSIELTLFEEVSLVREWGRVGQRGRPIAELCPDAAAARIEMEAWLRRKRRRGYEARL